MHAAQKKCSMTDMWHGQCVVEESIIGSSSTFTNTSMGAFEIASDWLLDIACRGGNTRSCVIGRVVGMMRDETGTKRNQKMQCFVSQVLANVEHMVSGDPFGEIVDVPIGYGAEIGIRLVDWESVGRAMGESNTHVLSDNEKLALLLRYMKKYFADNDLAMLNWRRDNDGTLRHSATGQVITILDVEHCMCKIHIVMEYMAGGARAATVNPTFQKVHCWPVMDATSLQEDGTVAGCFYNNEMASTHTKVIAAFQRRTEASAWVSMHDFDNSRKENTLLLGMVHGQAGATMEEVLVKKDLQAREIRDTCRCIQTEIVAGVKVCTIDCLPPDNLLGQVEHSAADSA